MEQQAPQADPPSSSAHLQEPNGRSATIDTNNIYPEATKNTHPGYSNGPQSSAQLNDARLSAALGMAGIKNPSHLPHKRSRSVDIVGVLIILVSLFSLFANYRSVLNIAFDVVYIVVGVGILMRSALARKIVVIVSVIGLIANVLGLLGVSVFTSGKESIIPILSILFSIAVQITVLSVLTWHKNESEFS